MPLPWKKVKSGRISQLVNDHINNSQKRRDGSSLVVETGFPTSLIDLFIKNREKLKKPSKKKRQNPPNTPVSTANDPLIEGSPISCPSPSPPPPPSLAGSSSPPSRNLSSSEGSVVGSSDRVTFIGGDGDEMVADVNRVLLGVLKIFLVVVLALGTKGLAVGITISAFLLLFLEYVSKHVSGLVRPCSVIVQAVGRLLRLNLDQKIGDDPCQEIQKVANHLDEIQPENEIIEEPCSEKPLLELMEMEPLLALIEKEEPMNDVAESKRKSRRAKIKSKMKKYVTKKFRNSVKHDEDLQRPAETVSVVSYEEQLDDEVREEDATTSELQSHGSEISEEADTKMEEKGLKWRHLVLCLIVLIGLMGGRALAIVLTLSWFLLLQLVEALPRFKKSG